MFDYRIIFFYFVGAAVLIVKALQATVSIVAMWKKNPWTDTHRLEKKIEICHWPIVKETTYKKEIYRLGHSKIQKQERICQKREEVGEQVRDYTPSF